MKISTNTIAVFSAILAFVGAITGVYTGAYFEKQLCKTSMNYTEKKAIIDKKIDLIERTVRIINQRENAKMYRNTMDLCEKKLGIVVAFSVQKDSELKKANNTPTSENIWHDFYEARKSLVNISSEFTTIMSLNAIFFNHEIEESLQKIEDRKEEWWKIDIKLFNDLIAEMKKDIKR